MNPKEFAVVLMNCIALAQAREYRRPLFARDLTLESCKSEVVYCLMA